MIYKAPVHILHTFSSINTKLLLKIHLSCLYYNFLSKNQTPQSTRQTTDKEHHIFKVTFGYEMPMPVLIIFLSMLSFSNYFLRNYWKWHNCRIKETINSRFEHNGRETALHLAGAASWEEDWSNANAQGPPLSPSTDTTTKNLKPQACSSGGTCREEH